MIELIPAALIHAELLAGMHKVCFAEPWSAGSMSEILAMPGAAGMIAVEDGALTPSLGGAGPAGLVLWRVAAGEAEILTIGVLPPWRRLGVGRQLLAAALEGARTVNAEAMFLEAAAGNTAALALYQAEGFARVGVRKGYYSGEDAVTMRKDL
ncbi:MAG: GNAT family N-acetyltransferase [Solirubrobacterales bacterium]